jgi:hypothetical protein
VTQSHPLTPAAFRRWLETLPPAETAGKRRRYFTCPIARYLTETRGEPYKVGENQYKPAHRDPCRRLPFWASEFIWAIDVAVPHERHGRIPAHECLAVLREVQDYLTELRRT